MSEHLSFDERVEQIKTRPIGEIVAELTDYAEQAAPLGPLPHEVKRLLDELARVTAENERLVAACEDFRDSVLNQRYQLEEPCLDSDQTNAVLGLYDDTIGAAGSDLEVEHE